MTATISRPSTVSLTAKESALFDAIADGMDEPGSGWLHELADPSRSVSAVLGSLIKKGLVQSSGNIAERGDPAVFWVELTAAGFAAVAAPAAPAGPCLPVIKPAAAPAVRPAAAPTGRPAATPAGPCLPVIKPAAAAVAREAVRYLSETLPMVATPGQMRASAHRLDMEAAEMLQALMAFPEWLDGAGPSIVSQAQQLKDRAAEIRAYAEKVAAEFLAEPDHSKGYHLSLKSRNRKTGPIPVSTTTAESCSPSCGFSRNGCYADGGPLRMHWDKVTAGSVGGSLQEFLAKIKALPANSLWRANQAGDLPHLAGRISQRFILGMVKANRGKRGFTFTHHKLTIGQNFRLVKFANRSGFRVNISTETESAADAAVSLGLPAVVAVNSAESRAGWQTAGGNRVVVCPAQTREDMDCKRCQLCHHRPPNLIVAFLAHGSSVKRANTAIDEAN